MSEISRLPIELHCRESGVLFFQQATKLSGIINRISATQRPNLVVVAAPVVVVSRLEEVKSKS